MALLKFPTDFFVLPILLSDSEQRDHHEVWLYYFVFCSWDEKKIPIKPSFYHSLFFL
jgi:hypothetical protein